MGGRFVHSRSSDLLKILPTLAVAVLAALLARSVFPRTVDRIVQGPPAVPDTIRVESIDLDTVFVDRIRVVVSTDTVNLVNSVTLTDTVFIADMKPMWYLRGLVAGQSYGDTTYAGLVQIAADSALWKRTALQKIFTTGPIRSIQTSERGLAIDFGDFPDESKGCSPVKAILGSAAGAVLGAAIGQESGAGIGAVGGGIVGCISR